MDYKKMFDKQLNGLEIDGENEEQVFEQVAEELRAEKKNFQQD